MVAFQVSPVAQAALITMPWPWWIVFLQTVSPNKPSLSEVAVCQVCGRNNEEIN